MHDDDDFDDDEFNVAVYSAYDNPWSDALMDFVGGFVRGAGWAFGFTAVILLALAVRAAVMFLV